MTLTKSQKKRRAAARTSRSQVPRPNRARQPKLPKVYRKARATPSRGMASRQFSQAVQEYAACLSNPFDGPLAGIPDYPVAPSQKHRCFARGTFSTGSASTGWVALNPYRPANDTVTNNATAAVYYSGPTNADSAITVPDNTGVGRNGEKFANSPFALADISAAYDDINYRVVGAGLRCRYIGTVLARGGQYFALAHPNHDTVASLTAANLGSFDTALIDRVGDEWITVLHRPIDAGELGFSIAPGQDSAAVSLGSPYLGILVTAPSTTPISFEWEAFVAYEFTGQKALAKTATVSDPAGFAAVLNAANSTNHLAMPHVGPSSRIQRNFLTDAWDFFTGKGGPVDFIDNRADKAMGAIEKLLPLLLALGI